VKVIFCDTTLSKEDFFSEIRKDYIILPAIRRGDLIRLLNQSSTIEEIIIVDGVFDQEPSITHKEILYTIENKVKVVGVSSIGALRAAELYKYGMAGAGEIFEAYLKGEFLSDEEVAVSFVKRNGKIYKTIPLINIRKTIEFFKLDEEILKKAKKIFYKQRSWEKLKKVLLEEEYIQLKSNYIDQKKQDVIDYIKTGKCLIYSPLIGKKYDHYSSFYFKKELASITNNGPVAFMKKRLLDKEPQPGSFENRILALYLTRVITINEEYCGVIQEYLHKVKKVQINTIRISQFNREILKELNINSQDNLLEYMRELDINKTNLNAIFTGLYKLYLLFMNEYNS